MYTRSRCNEIFVYIEKHMRNGRCEMHFSHIVPLARISLMEAFLSMRLKWNGNG
jgi:hypothetical protein